MKKIMQLEILLMVAAAAFGFASAYYEAPAQQCQTDQTVYVKHISSSTKDSYALTVEISVDGNGKGGHQHSTTGIRKYKPRSTQPTRMTDMLNVKHAVITKREPENIAEKIRRRVADSRLILSVIELKHAHTMFDRKIFTAASVIEDARTA